MLGALIGAGSSLLGGFLAGKARKKEYKRQVQFAQNGIQWKAADAEKAGISKYYALGANTASYAPQSVGGDSSGVASAGAELGRAVAATQTQDQRQGGIAHSLAKTQLEGLQIDNDIKRAELASRLRVASQPGTPPPYPGFNPVPHVPGQGNSTLKITKKVAPSGHSPDSSAGVHPEVDWYRGRHGYTPQIPQDLAESFENNWAGSAAWQLRNSLGPYLGLPSSLPPAKKGYFWHFNPIHGYQLKKNPDNHYRLRIPRGRKYRR